MALIVAVSRFRVDVNPFEIALDADINTRTVNLGASTTSTDSSDQEGSGLFLSGYVVPKRKFVYSTMY